MSQYISGQWFFDESWNAWKFIKPGNYDVGAMLSDDAYSHLIPADHVRMLITELDTQGWIKPRLDERLRQDDLKITHRIIDLLEKSIGGDNG